MLTIHEGDHHVIALVIVVVVLNQPAPGRPSVSLPANRSVHSTSMCRY